MYLVKPEDFDDDKEKKINKINIELNKINIFNTNLGNFFFNLLL